MTSERWIVELGDVHMGHPNTPATLIAKNLRKALPNTAVSRKLDAIILSGDFFDRSLSLHDPAVATTQIWIYELLTMAANNDIEVWVLEGTPSHDWGQSALFELINEQGKIGAKLRYVNKLAIEYSERLGNILFIPDEWAEPDETWRQVRQLMQEKGLEKVDYAVMHGAFEHQLPPQVTSPKHNAERYLSIVRKYIFIGHIHKASQLDRILAAGSFDRLAHGEEEPKGHWLVRVDGPQGDQLTFVENTGAKIYRTIDVQGLSVDEALDKLKQVESLPEGSAIRIRAKQGDPLATGLDMLRRKYPNLVWSVDSIGASKTQARLLVDLRSTFQRVPLTRSNLPELLLARIRTLTDNPGLIERCEQRLSETMQ